MNVSGESPVSPKCKKHPILLSLCISAQSAAVEALCIFSRHHNRHLLTLHAPVFGTIRDG